MSLTVCKVHLTPNSEKILYVSHSLFKKLKLASKKSIRLRLGKTCISAKIKPISKPGIHLYVTSGLRSSIRIPKSGHIYLLRENENHIQLGPLIGIMSDKSSFTSSSPFGSRTNFIKQILLTGNKIAYVFAFTPHDINWQNNTINAYFITPSSSWIRKIVPLPDVIYNRLPSRRAETSHSYNIIREKFMRKGIAFFNWSFFNKSDVYALLQDEMIVQQYVPESIMNPAPSTILSMLKKHKFAYYKPSGGSLGIGIYRLTYLPHKGYFARYTSNGRNVLLRFKSFSSLIRMLEARHGRSLRNYVIQQGVRLIEMNGCPIDFRFHMHKNRENKWTVVGIGAKQAGKGSVTTHVKNGGKLLTPSQALQHIFSERADEVLTKAKQITIELAEAIERNYPHLLGELGLDIGIDQSENIWMFEANAKPGRSIFKHPHLKKEGQSSIEHILHYCLYVSNFGKEDLM